ncbi:MAG: glycosyltransferase family 4 protein [Bacteroides sp.]|nr:glycosyltransferase family 4 protein [Eubacterium sp.]MCM1418486.1 glycosyltransferase family 4 protein [Roseburia sp.]MCM1462505.1 glycosyltransferase family 4 protein [Bacteroides sp.]
MEKKIKVCLYSEMQKQIEKSGVGRAIYHQKNAAALNGIEIVERVEDADVVHINTVFFKSWLVAKRAKKAGKAVVYHAHSTREDFRNSYLGSNLFSGFFQKWITFCYSLGDVIVTPSEYSKSLLRGYGITKEIRVVSNGIDLGDYVRDEAAGRRFREKYGIRPEEKVVIGAGLIIGRKGIVDFVELARRLPQYRFFWFGDSNLNFVSRAVRRAAKTTLPNLTFAGYVDKAALKEAHCGSDLFLFPSFEETEGIVVLEALALKTPALLRRIAVYDGWLAEDRDVYMAGDLDEFQRKITDILEKKSPDLTESGYRVAESKRIEDVGRALAEIYRSLG